MNFKIYFSTISVGSIPRYGRAFCRTSAQTGPERAPPLVVQLWGSSRQISTASRGASMGATATKLAMRAPRFAVQLLAGAAFAAHTVAGHRRPGAGAFGDHPFHQLAHRGAGFSRNDLPLHCRFYLFYYCTVRGGNALYNIGLHQPPAVDHSTHRCKHLQIADLAALAEGTGCQFHRTHPAAKTG